MLAWVRFKSNCVLISARAAASKPKRKDCLNESSSSGNVWSDTGAVQVSR